MANTKNQNGVCHVITCPSCQVCSNLGYAVFTTKASTWKTADHMCGQRDKGWYESTLRRDQEKDRREREREREREEREREEIERERERRERKR